LLKALLLQAKRWAWAALQVSEYSVSELECAQQLRERKVLLKSQACRSFTGLRTQIGRQRQHATVLKIMFQH
jgi:hypothetical protein